MAKRSDLARLQKQTLASTDDEEAVTVNTRALIDKVLARYSGEWTTLRELIQNAADASAKKIIIKYETYPSTTVLPPPLGDDSAVLKHILLHHTISSLEVSNDGQPFAESDWNRLKRIAEGNPDETKIGAFGVGFYSVFADCEEPFVVSGNRALAFSWKNNSLFTKPNKLDPKDSSSETTFALKYRNTTSPVPDLMSLSNFLATSLTFIGIESIELYLDNWKVFTLNKTSTPGASVQIPSSIKTRTQDGWMKVVGVLHQNVQINATWMNVLGWTAKTSQLAAEQDDAENSGPTLRSLFSRFKSTGAGAAAAKRAKEAEQQQQDLVSEKLVEMSGAGVSLRISTVNIQTYLAAQSAKELERATKKPPPKATRIAILTSSHTTPDSSANIYGLTSEKSAKLFDSVIPTKNGRIFIGFPTAQTTGLLCHISAPSVIPTVEREQIDLNANYVKSWNAEMLRAAGIACRIAYMGEMDELKKTIRESMKTGNRVAVGPSDIDSAVPQATHVFKQYTANESTPSSMVGKLIEDGFWESSVRSSIDVLSTKGVLPSVDVRVVSEPLTFIENLPTIPSTLVNGAMEFVQKLYERHLVTDMTVKDIRKELESRSLDDAQLLEFLKWAGAQLAIKQLNDQDVKSLLSSGVATISNGVSGNNAGRIMVLGQITTFLSGSKIPPDVPLPPYTIPFNFTRGIDRRHLEAFGWEELQVVPWIRFLIGEMSSLPQNQWLTKSPEMAHRVLSIVSKQWNSLSESSKTTLVEILSKHTVIPSKSGGMCRPTESYFPSVKLFSDLPVMGSLPGVKENVLTALGVRKTIELNVVFERLMSQPSEDRKKWSFTDLIRYLVSVKDDIPKQDIDRLRTTAICPVETGDVDNRSTSGRICKVSELFEPKDLFITMRLPTLHWPAGYRAASAEGRFLSFLGLKSTPKVADLINVMALAVRDKDRSQWITALRYFIDFHHTNRYGNFDLKTFGNLKFLPVEGQEFPNCVSPLQCYSNPKSAIMGCKVLAQDYVPHAVMLGVAQDPPMEFVIEWLIKTPPQSHRETAEIFGYMAGRLSEISGALATRIGAAPIVPILERKGEKTVLLRYNPPNICFLGDSATYHDIFDFVDFGPEANAFLLKAGSKHEPSSLELGKMIIDNASKVLATLGTERYTELLRKLAENHVTLKIDKTLWKALQTAPCLLAYKEQASDATKSTRALDSVALDDFPLDEDEATIRVYSLRKAADIVIPDEIRALMIFGKHLSLAPPDESLERFYQSLGTPTLSSLIDLNHRVGHQRNDQSEAVKLRARIMERARLFLHEYTQNVRHDIKWLDKALAVSQVDSIHLSSTLRGYPVAPYSESKTATLNKERDKRYTLLITKNPQWYEISAWIVRLILNRPNQSDTLALEMVLKSELKELRAKGYNVDRILRKKEYETRIEEDERKKQRAVEQAEKERKRALEKEKVLPPPPSYESTTSGRGSDGMSKPHDDIQLPNMPGAFQPDSPQGLQGSAVSKPDKKPAPGLFGAFSDSFHELGKQFGIRDQLHVDNVPHRIKDAGEPSGPPPDPASAEKNITKNLTNAIQACRSATSNDVFSAPQTTAIEESKGSYCDSTPAQNLSMTSTSAGGLKIFIANHMGDQAQRLGFISSQRQNLDTFSFILLDLGSIFNVPPQSLHIFYDASSATIAFNQSGALFFNYHYFHSMHLPHWNTSYRKKFETLSYWYVTMTHELAHNIVKEHSAQHSFYTESFAGHFMFTFHEKAKQY